MDGQATMTESKPELSFGQRAVGITFNPSNNPEVEAIKRSFAGNIDLLNGLREATDNPEKKRMYSIAITECQQAQMWAVKGSTWQY